MNKLIINKIQKKLGYYFKNINFLFLALTHKSISKKHNERLEFLGDSILNFIISNILYKKFPLINDGEISKIKSDLINSKTLFKISIKLNLYKYIKINKNIFNNNNINIKILSNTFEAILGSIFLDSNINTIEKIIFNLYNKKIKKIFLINNKDYKTFLQEILQKKYIKKPNYLIKKKKKLFIQKIIINCKLNCFRKLFFGIGKNRNDAEQNVAKKIIQQMEK
ncbi:ribonuclease III [Enterobacterales bacterium endosymbiont of Anomoneura mori]|uniref:ribonuclease III n=1 Tax=Enterobacterales bacterium endosymbiont of Anomoneura mori TaxID=3132096 RepID=UPI00399D2509